MDGDGGGPCPVRPWGHEAGGQAGCVYAACAAGGVRCSRGGGNGTWAVPGAAKRAS